jgi:hypothetical protein
VAGYPQNLTNLANSYEPVPLSGQLGESFPRYAATGVQLFFGSGEMQLAAVPLIAGQVVGHLAWCSDTTAAVTPTNQWLALFNLAGVMLANTADQLSAPIPATTYFEYPIAQVSSGPVSSYVVPATGIYFIGIVVAAATMPSVSGITGLVTMLQEESPMTCAIGQAGLTGPPAYPFTSPLSATGRLFWLAALQ